MSRAGWIGRPIACKVGGLLVGFGVRRLGTGHFSREPLNFETWSGRIREFYQVYDFRGYGQDSTATPARKLRKPPPKVLTDLVEGGRKLQRKNECFNSDLVKWRHGDGDKGGFLGLETWSNRKVEEMIESMLEQCLGQLVDNSVVKAYLTVDPKPSSPLHIISMVAHSFRGQSPENGDDRDRKQMVETGINLLLLKKDYYNAFELIDRTYNLSTYLNSCATNDTKNLAIIGVVGSLLTGVETGLLPDFSMWVWAWFDLVCPLTVYAMLLRIKLIQQLGRIGWRPYTNFIRNGHHVKEMLFINKIINHFEEHNEVTIRNFHHSKVRQAVNLNVFHSNDYIIELPDNEQLISPGETPGEGKESEQQRLQRFFKAELQQRSMVINELQEELNFLEFWLTHGEVFEWVEPDQDPAEIVKLKIE